MTSVSNGNFRNELEMFRQVTWSSFKLNFMKKGNRINKSKVYETLEAVPT